MTDTILAGLVKPLVWSDYETDEGIKGKRCSTGIGMCLCLTSGWFLVGQSGWKKAPNIEAAQAAAQANYAARVLASIDADKLRALVEAGNWLSVCAQTTGGTAGRDDELVAAVARWTAALQEPGPTSSRQE